ncbi:DHS-like NAD/FAD-binding domain-containing protein [Laetiporus sulphureus 93-53]|uniref:NAD-dependent protein deacylase n=1 Tax=Laetiporus sulphureus 93-53 TaxID=1314785 RepID=A0A165DIP6_9APHY|nr:DHS-like NAD/FAD-binding domain-containing protein [Laetiporus sulphureus 93-53]KZT04968.1 DHS-like NAD/FAD-binding domain-containing protein [Laetiporus sulphureus 93-53]
MLAFKRVLRSSKHIMAVAGAGLSSASGIPTFRGAGGMWRKYDAMSLATPTAFPDNPSRVWQFYHYRREKALKAQPNAAHDALARFSFPSVRDRIAPSSTFTLITQNVDGLSQRALNAASSALGIPIPEDAIQPVMLEMHGRLFDVVCTAYDCQHREANFDSPICPALAGTEELVEKGVIEPDIPPSELPRCRKCGALARPGVVWFEEVPHHMKKIYELVEKTDLCLVVGTSSTVYPAAGLAYEVKEHGGKVAIFNLDRSRGDDQSDFVFLGPCEKTLPEALSVDT